MERSGSKMAREREAFERRMTEAWPEVTRLVERLLAWPGKAADVEDVVQDVFLNAWRSRAQFQGDAKWSTWVHRIAVHRARSAGRARASRGRWFGKLLGDEELAVVSGGLGGGRPSTESSAESSTEASAEALALRSALARLCHADREVLVLRYLEELEVEEVAQRLTLKRAAVDARLSRARKRLRALTRLDPLQPGAPEPNAFGQREAAP